MDLNLKTSIYFFYFCIAKFSALAWVNILILRKVFVYFDSLIDVSFQNKSQSKYNAGEMFS